MVIDANVDNSSPKSRFLTLPVFNSSHDEKKRRAFLHLGAPRDFFTEGGTRRKGIERDEKAAGGV